MGFVLILAPLVIGVIAVFLMLSPKGSDYAKNQYEKSQEKITKLAS